MIQTEKSDNDVELHCQETEILKDQSNPVTNSSGKPKRKKSKGFVNYKPLYFRRMWTEQV